MGKSIWISLTLDQVRELNEVARGKHASASEIARRAVAKYLEKQRTKHQRTGFPSVKNIEFNGQEVGPLSSKASRQQQEITP